MKLNAKLLEAYEDLRQYIIEGKDVGKLQLPSFIVAVSLLMGIYFASVFIAPGFVTYVLTFPAALVIALTSLARVNDIGVEKMSKRWHVRRIGLIMAGAGAVMMMASYWTDRGLVIAWRTVVIVWGVALAWLTTPEMPPWEDYITGKYRDKDYRVLKNFLGRRRASQESVPVTPIVEVEPMRRGDGDGP